MTTPFPSPADATPYRQSVEEICFVARGIATAIGAGDELAAVQRAVVGALVRSMSGGVEIDLTSFEPVSASEFAEVLADFSVDFRVRVVQAMGLGQMILPEPSVEVADRVIEYAEALGVGNDFLTRAREVADGSRLLVAADFDRTQYLADLDLSGFTPRETPEHTLWAWTNTVDLPALARQWRELGDLDEGTLGRQVHDFYVARGFRFPGEPGSAPPLLAQHDWVHVLADYGSVVASELEVFGFIARASSDPRAFAILAMAISLFHTGRVEGAAGIFEVDPGHLDRDGMPERFADALRRGACVPGGVDFLAVDYFAFADQPIEQVRDHFGIVPKSPDAIAAGSPSPWTPGGMSEFQLRAGIDLALSSGRPYESFGASP